MRWASIVLLLFLAHLANAQKREKVIIENEIYRIVYSEVLEQPVNVRYRVLCPNGTASRAGMGFQRIDGIHTSDEDDYEDNVWDKGHCAPAADFGCTREMVAKTFSYVNCVLQHEKLNRGVWRSLEEYERKLASRSTVDVEIVVIFSNASIRLPTGATVPDGFQKRIYQNGRLSECYYFDNTVPIEPDYRRYKTDCKNKKNNANKATRRASSKNEK